MKRGLLLLVVAIAAGCSGDPPPIHEAKPLVRETPVAVEFQPPAKPEKSDPAAAKVIADALAAHTGNDLGKLDKLKATAVTRTGITKTPDGLRVPLTCNIEVFAPGRYRAELEVRRPDGAEKFAFVVAPTAGTFTPAGKTKLPLDEATLLDLHAQRAEDEMLLLFPLADPATVAVPATDEVVNGSPAVGVYAWTPALAPVRLHFDKGTRRLVRLVYTGRERGFGVLKDITVREHAQTAGVWLPVKYLLRAKGVEFLDVEKQTYEIGKTFDPERFKP